MIDPIKTHTGDASVEGIFETAVILKHKLPNTFEDVCKPLLKLEKSKPARVRLAARGGILITAVPQRTAPVDAWG
jgi:hypothetical protein